LHCHGFQLNKNYYSLLSKQGRTQLIYSTELTTEYVFEYFGGNCPVALPLIVGTDAGLASITYKQELQTAGISSKAINTTLLHKPDN